MSVLAEVGVDSVSGVRLAAAAGGDRVKLCSATGGRRCDPIAGPGEYVRAITDPQIVRPPPPPGRNDGRRGDQCGLS